MTPLPAGDAQQARLHDSRLSALRSEQAARAQRLRPATHNWFDPHTSFSRFRFSSSAVAAATHCLSASAICLYSRASSAFAAVDDSVSVGTA
jgi:hypothetical protein